MKRLRRLVRKLWWHSSDRGVQWPWRPYCWARRRHEPHGCDRYFQRCVWCGLVLWSHSRHGFPDPYIWHTRDGWAHVDAPVGARRRARLIVAAKQRHIAELEAMLTHAGVDLREAGDALRARQRAGEEIPAGD